MTIHPVKKTFYLNLAHPIDIHYQAKTHFSANTTIIQ